MNRGGARGGVGSPRPAPARRQVACRPSPAAPSPRTVSRQGWPRGPNAPAASILARRWSAVGMRSRAGGAQAGAGSTSAVLLRSFPQGRRARDPRGNLSDDRRMARVIDVGAEHGSNARRKLRSLSRRVTREVDAGQGGRNDTGEDRRAVGDPRPAGGPTVLGAGVAAPKGSPLGKGPGPTLNGRQTCWGWRWLFVNERHGPVNPGTRRNVTLWNRWPYGVALAILPGTACAQPARGGALERAGRRLDSPPSPRPLFRTIAMTPPAAGQGQGGAAFGHTYSHIRDFRAVREYLPPPPPFVALHRPFCS